MRGAYALLGIAWIVVFAGLYIFLNHKIIPLADTTNTFMSDSLTLTSDAFAEGGNIPSKFTCDVETPVNPPLTISGVPEGAKSLALIVDDPDVPKEVLPAGVFDHWILFNIPPQTAEIAAGMTVGTPGANGAGKLEYAAPCPPAQYEPSEHRYVFALYALDSTLSLPAGATKEELVKAMQGHIVAQTELMGRYKRQ